jgi:hypothetical protein
MECDKIKILLSAYLDGELEAGEQEQLEEHLLHCVSCRQDLDQLKSYLDLAGKIPRGTAPDGLKDITWQAVRSKETTPLIARTLRNKSFQVVSALAAAAVIILYLAINPNFINTTHVSSDLVYKVTKKGKGPGESNRVMTDESREVKMLIQMTARAEGQVIEEGINNRTGMTDFIRVRIPKKNYPGFRAALLEAGKAASLPDELSPMIRYISIRMYFPGRKLLVGDVNGDGRSDIATYLRRGKNTGQWYVSLHLKDADFSEPETMKLNDSTLFLKDLAIPLLFDLNGDGLSDLLISGPGFPWKTYINKGENNFMEAMTIIPADNLPSLMDLYVPLTGDFNGDGLDDLAVHYLKGNFAGHWFISLNKGNMMFDGFREFSMEDDLHENGIRYLPFVLDFDGDGYDDAGKYWQQGDLDASWFIGINDLEEGFMAPARVYFGNSPLAFQGDYLPFTGDFNGDGFDDLLVKSGTQDETGEWYLEYNEAGIKFTYGYDVKIGANSDFIVK